VIVVQYIVMNAYRDGVTALDGEGSTLAKVLLYVYNN
jgi:hypothetical protein